jgi:hypothetical protein
MPKELRITVVVPVPDDAVEQAKRITAAAEPMQVFMASLNAALPGVPVTHEFRTVQARAKTPAVETAPARAPLAVAAE